METETLQTLIKNYRKKKTEANRVKLLSFLDPLVGRIAKKFSYRGESYEDLYQIGMLGIWRAVDSIKNQKKGHIVAYLIERISGEIKHYFRDKFKSIRLPRKYLEVSYQMNRYIQDYYQKNKGKKPSINEIAKALKHSPELILETMEAIQVCSVVNLDKDNYFKEVVSNSEQQNKNDKESLTAQKNFTEKVTNSLYVEDMLRGLPYRERKVLQMYFWRSMTQREIAKRFSISQTHVNRLLDKAVYHCRRKLPKDLALEDFIVERNS